MASGVISASNILSWICSAGGVVQLSELCEQNFFSSQLTAKFVLQRYQQYYRLEGTKVYAYTTAEICHEYEPRQGDCRVPGCNKFHLCKHFVTGSCKFGNRYVLLYTHFLKRFACYAVILYSNMFTNNQ